MESLPKSSVLEFNPDTMVSVRKRYNLNSTARMNEAIDILEEWIKKQDHFVKQTFPREYLEKTIIYSKGSVERAKNKVDRLCYFRSVHPIFFEMFQRKEINLLSALMPKLTPGDHRIYLLNNRMLPGFVNTGYLNHYKFIIYMLQYMLKSDYCDGIIGVVDYREANIMELIKFANVVELKQLMSIIMEGFGMRIIGIHMLTNSTAIDVVVSLLKKVMSEKVAKRIHVHTSLESLHELVPKEMLPEEYGGNEKPLAELQENFLNGITSDDNVEYITELNKACTKEEYRQKEEINNDFLPGTFMSLNLD